MGNKFTKNKHPKNAKEEKKTVSDKNIKKKEEPKPKINKVENGKNELKIELYTDREERYSFPKEELKNSSVFFHTMSSLEPERKLAFIDTNVPIFNGFFTALTNHLPIRLKPDDIWLLIIQSFSNHINENSEKLRNMFVNFEGQKTITINYSLSDINQITKEIHEDFIIQINEKLKEHLGEEILNILTPDFSTTTKDSSIVCKITIMSAFKKFFKYRISLKGCGVPYIILEGTAEDYKKIIIKAKELRKYDFEWYIDRIIPLIQKMVDAKEGNIDIDHFKNMIQNKELVEQVTPPSGSKPEDRKFDTLDGWFLKFFAYYAPLDYFKHYRIFDGNSIKIKDINKLANQILKAPFTVEDKVHKREYEMEYKVGFVGCDQNEKKEVFPVMGWCVGPFKEEEENVFL